MFNANRSLTEPPSRHRRRRRLAALAATALASSLTVIAPGTAGATTSIQDLTSLTPEQLAQSLVGPGVSISNVTYTGAAQAAGTFTGGTGNVGFAEGVVLGSGNIANTAGPNNLHNTTTSFGGAGNADLTALAGVSTRDAAVLEFDFTADAETVFFNYVFGSEEYLEFVNSSFNDVFAFFVNDVNCAVVPDGSGGTAPVTINTINPSMNASLYRDNPVGSGAIDIEMDGLTIGLTCMAPVNVGTNTMTLAIADGSDTILDSAVWLQQGSLTTTPPAGTAKVTGGGSIDVPGGSFNLGTVVIRDEQGLRGNLQLNDHRTKDRVHGYDVDSFTVNNKTATWTGSARFNGADGYRFEASITDNRNGNSTKKGSPDTVSVTVFDSDDNVVWTSGGPMDLTKGNVRLHS